MNEDWERFHPINQYREDLSFDISLSHPLSLRERRDKLLSSYTFDRKVLVRALKEYNTSMGACEKTLSAISKLLYPSTTAVVSGQQAGLMTGPLYTIYKAISLLKMVERLKREGLEVVPIFWVASEDHDYEEINHIHILNPSNHLKRLELAGEVPKESVGRIPLERRDAHELLAHVARETAETEFKEEVMDLLYKTLEGSKTLVHWFSRLLLSLFSKRGLILFDPLIESLQEEKKSFFQKLYLERHALARALQTGEEEILERGHSLQVKRKEGQLPFFLTYRGRREALFEKREGFISRRGEMSLSFSQLETILEREPERITSTVLTRPLLESYLLPTLIYIAGPSEMAYQAQLKEAYPLLWQTPPFLYPRPGMTIIEGRVAEHMERYGLTFERVLLSLDREREERLKEASPIDVESLFGGVREHWDREYTQLIEEIKSLHPKLEDLGFKNKDRILREMKYLEEKTLQFHRRKSKVLLGHFQRVEEALKPQGKLQERVLNLSSFLIKYGVSFLEEIHLRLILHREHTIFYYRGGI